MIILCLTIAVLLGWSLGKNNMGNLFGTAIGTRMVQLRTASVLALVFVFIGAFYSGSATTSSILTISELKTSRDIIVVMLSAAIVLEGLSKLGIPASIVQTIVGSLVGWNLFHQSTMDWYLVGQMMGSWFCAPAVAAVISLLCMIMVRFILNKYPISIFIRDMMVRIGLVFIGILAAYALGANNAGTIAGPYMNVVPALTSAKITCIVCMAIGVGCLMADKKVIATVGRKIFPLSPTEALIVMIGTDISMICFSLEGLKAWLEEWHLPTFPLVPIPMSGVMIGAIFGIALTKKCHGLNVLMLTKIVISWLFVPITACGLCYALLSIHQLSG